CGVALAATVAFSAVLATTTGAHAQSAFDNCAAEAASQWEAGFETVGRHTWTIDASAAIAACQGALEQDPANAQLKAWLGRAHFAGGQPDVGAPLLEEAAAAGNLVALSLFGDMLISGDGVAQDMPRGAQMLRDAAEAGFPPAQNSLGLSYDFGEGVEQDYA